MPVARSRLEILQVCKLLQCVREQDRYQIEKLAASGVPHLINYNEPYEGETALGQAACRNDEDMIEFLLGLGAHPDVVDFKGRTASMKAAEYGHVECLEKLTTAGASMLINDAEGRGILFFCINSTRRHKECMRIVMSNGAEVNSVAKDGVSLLLMACETAKDNEDMCIQLLEWGADPNVIPEESKRTPLMAASESGSLMVVKSILEHKGEINVLDGKRHHAAHFAAKEGHVDILLALSGYGAKFEQLNFENNSPIHLAAKNNQALCCRYLAQRGCNPKLKNKEGITARAVAKEKGNKAAMKDCRRAEKFFGKITKNNEPWRIIFYDWVYEHQKQLKNYFENLDPEKEGNIPKQEFFEILANLQAPLDEDNAEMISRMYDPRRSGEINYIDFFTGKKYINKKFLANIYEVKKKKAKKEKRARKAQKKIPFPVCVQSEGERTFGGAPPAVYIEKHTHFTDSSRFDRDRPPQHPLQDDSMWYVELPEKTYVNINDAVRFNDMESLKRAFSTGTPVDIRDKHFKTPLMIACGKGHMEIVKMLLEKEANVNAVDNFKWTPLHYACHAGQLDIVQLLLEMGVNINALCLNGGSPLNRAIENSQLDVVELLLSNGANLRTQNRNGLTPLDVTYAWADPRLINLIQEKWDNLPPPPEEKKKKKEPKKISTKSEPTPEDTGPQIVIPALDEIITDVSVIQRAASALARGKDEREDISYSPLQHWTKQLDTGGLLKAKISKRERYGWQVDFPDFQMPFNKNVTAKANSFLQEVS